MYYLLFKDGTRYGPIVGDNPERETYTDFKIKYKANYWAKRLDAEVEIV